MSEAVERRLVEILGHPTESPFGNPIPGLDELGSAATADASADGGAPVSRLAGEEPSTVTVVRIAETLQADEAMMGHMRRIGAVPGGTVLVERVDNLVRITGGDGSVELAPTQAVQVIVELSATP